MAEGAAGALALRSGDQKTSTTAAFFSHVVADAAGAHKLDGVAFSYRYAAGFAPSSGAAANFSLVALAVDPCVDGPGPVVAVLYSSPPLADFPYSACDDYTPRAPGGYLAGGDDVWSGDVTLAQAQGNCSAMPACVGLTYNGPLSPSPGTTVHAYRECPHAGTRHTQAPLSTAPPNLRTPPHPPFPPPPACSQERH